MNAVAASLERRALSLGTANAIDFALQFMLPIVLTRTLDPHAFGESTQIAQAAITPAVDEDQARGRNLGQQGGIDAGTGGGAKHALCHRPQREIAPALGTRGRQIIP